VDVVGRNEGEELKNLRENAKKNDQVVGFLQADLSTVKGVHSFLDKVKQSGKLYDYLVVTVAVFPDWVHPLTAEGLEKMFATIILGRYVLYKNCHTFLNPSSSRVVHVLASGRKSSLKKIDRDLLLNKRNYTSTFRDAIPHISNLGELLNLELEKRWASTSIQLVGTHPGIIYTQLAKDALVYEIFGNTIVQSMLGFISEDQAGENIARILVDNKKIHKKLTLFDEKNRARIMADEIRQVYKNEGEWLIKYLDSLEEKFA